MIKTQSKQTYKHGLKTAGVFIKIPKDKLDITRGIIIGYKNTKIKLDIKHTDRIYVKTVG
jgi:hypothetical protein